MLAGYPKSSALTLSANASHCTITSVRDVKNPLLFLTNTCPGFGGIVSITNPLLQDDIELNFSVNHSRSMADAFDCAQIKYRVLTSTIFLSNTIKPLFVVTDIIHSTSTSQSVGTCVDVIRNHVMLRPLAYVIAAAGTELVFPKLSSWSCNKEYKLPRFALCNT